MSTYLDLRGVCNMGLADEYPEDGVGGWSDQGPNDLSMLPVGKQTFAGIPFWVIEPETNKNKAAVVLARTKPSHFPEKTDWVKVDSQFEYLYVLHGAAWAQPGAEPYATIDVKYRDGKEISIPLRVGEEVFDWHDAKGAAHGPLGWIGKNPRRSPIGLHVLEWKNPRPGEYVTAIRFVSKVQGAMPGFLAATVTSRKFDVTGPSRHLRDMPIQDAKVKYMPRVHVGRRFLAVDAPEVVVKRRLPAEAKNLKRLLVQVRLKELTEGDMLNLTIGGKTYSQKLKKGDWIVKFNIDDKPLLAYLKKNYDSFIVGVICSGDSRVGCYWYDSSPNVHETPTGQDGENQLVAVRVGAIFGTSDPDLAKWGHLMLQPKPRSAPEATTTKRTATKQAKLDPVGRMSLCLNGVWELGVAPPEKAPAKFAATVRVPGVWSLAKGLPAQEPETHSLWYRTKFYTPSGVAKTSRLVLDYEKVSYKTTVYVNGQKVGEHLGDIEPFAFDVTQAVHATGKPNELLICVEDHHNYFKPVRLKEDLDPGNIQKVQDNAYFFNLGECGVTDEMGRSTLKVYENGKPLGPAHSKHDDIRKLGGGRFSHLGNRRDQTLLLSTSDNTDPRKNGREYEIRFTRRVADRITQRLDYHPGSKTMEYWAGILGDVTLQAIPAAEIEDVFVRTSVRHHTITVQCQLAKTAGKQGGTVSFDVLENGKIVKPIGSVPVSSLNAFNELAKSARWENPKLWSPADPHMYSLRTKWISPEGKVLDEVYTRFGFREFRVQGTQFLLNEEPIMLQGDSPNICHYRIPVRHHLRERARMKMYRGMNCNLLRLHQSGLNDPLFCRTGDEMGMLICLEATHIPWEWIWDWKTQTVNEEHFKQYLKQFRDWARRFRNHPSLVLYSIQNEYWSRIKTDPEEVKRNKQGLEKVLRRLNDVVCQEDPSRLTQFHGSEGIYIQDGAPWSPVANLHYQWQISDTENWKERVKQRPLIIGELAFQGRWVFFSTDLERRAKDKKVLLDYFWDTAKASANRIGYYIDLYRGREIPGIMPYGMESWCTNPLDPRGLGNQTAPLEYPALSGPGQKPQEAQIFTVLKQLNWFDPKYPEHPWNFVSDTLADHFAPQPLPSFDDVRPEVIVRVWRNGKTVSRDYDVMLHPLEGQGTEPVGSVTDSDGRAWILVPEAGRYSAVVTTPEGDVFHSEVTPEPAKEYGRVATVDVHLDSP
ncbi:MAG: beta galactosidase jelly roll domain-containing protein [Phycisphaerae bacterium]|nr:beta galactosidase jelly roll domain-containing protein [Phycisphaerae bacterium]